ncbi:MAG: bifunctional UDP-N-acetylmuramoyl-tripeptide:D-alanyl-D-alanine ligase/alanine racemase, partial [Bacteroidales bacterium]|nr:bifunctional UDP-N-acetylmuramoyl-tripeptide:D-alanyl-D-alanine ligase/alanine racemase [Bacteroidales bacterium]
MANYTSGEIAKAVNGEIFGNKNIYLNKLATDSRSVFNVEGVLFFAISGQHHDGHNFIERLIKRGVKAFVVSDKNYCTQNNDLCFILVKDSVKALQMCALMHRNNFNKPVVGITGSNGKTIVKEWLSHVLSTKIALSKSPKSYNSQIGVPLSVWQIDKQHKLAIIEAGISQTNEMQSLETVIKPDIGIFTNIGNAHQKNFQTLKQKIEEKAKLFENSKKLVYCADYPEITEVLSKYKSQEHFSWSLQGNGKINFEIQTRLNSFSILKFEFENKQYEIQTNSYDKASIENAINTLVACLALGFDINDFAEAFTSLPILNMRFETIDGINESKIINDAYSLDINSLEIALDNLLNQAGKHRKIVILSDILQSDLSSKAIYTKVADMIKARNIDLLIGIGENISSHYYLFKENSLFYLTTNDFIENSFKIDIHNSEILIKGARNFNFEKIVAHFEKQSHETVFTINLTAIEHNLNYFRQKVGKNVKTMVMVKAFSYGVGYYEIASLLEYLKIDYLAVAYVDEGVDLRRKGISLPIMVMSPSVASLQQMIEYELEPEIYSFDILEALILELAKSGRKQYPIHVKLDTGMHRLGFCAENIQELKSKLYETDSISVKSVMSHLAAGGIEQYDEFTHNQAEKFKEMAKEIANPETLLHIANSSGILRFPEYHFDMIRLGIGLYGFADDNNLQHSV